LRIQKGREVASSKMPGAPSFPLSSAERVGNHEPNPTSLKGPRTRTTMGAPGLDAGVPSDRSSSLGWSETWESKNLSQPLRETGPTSTEASHALALQLLSRYGILTRESVAAENIP